MQLALGKFFRDNTERKGRVWCVIATRRVEGQPLFAAIRLSVVGCLESNAFLFLDRLEAELFTEEGLCLNQPCLNNGEDKLLRLVEPHEPPILGGE